MKCPTCSKGNLFLFKETEVTYHIPLTKRNTIHKRKPFNIGIEHDTEKVYLQCDDMTCGNMFDYELDSIGRVIRDSLTER